MRSDVPSLVHLVAALGSMTDPLQFTPIYKHDCSAEYGCIWLGTWVDESLDTIDALHGLRQDLYVHPRDYGVEMIHRYNDAGEKYGCMTWPHPAPVYQEIERRCRERGIKLYEGRRPR